MNILNTGLADSSSISSTEELQKIWQQDPMLIVIKLFDKTLLHIGRAKSAISGWGDERFEAHVLNAISVIEGLQMTLEDQSQSQMAVNLDDIYRYIARLLINSIQKQDLADLNQAAGLLIEIRESMNVFVKKTPKMLQH